MAGPIFEDEEQGALVVIVIAVLVVLAVGIIGFAIGRLF